VNGSSLLPPPIVPMTNRQASELASTSSPVSVEEGYSRWAATYDQTPNPLLALEQRCLLPMFPNIAGKHLLDLACGTARWLEKLLQAKPALAIGVDLSGPMLATARKKATVAGQLVRADCLELPLATNSFDLAVCSFAIEHITGLSEMAAESSRVLKRPADLFITGLHPAAYAAGWRAGFRDRQGAMQIHSTTHSIEEIVKVFSEAGFKHSRTLECFLGEPERPLFASAGKEQSFDAARKLPAVVILHFQTCTHAPENQTSIGIASSTRWAQ
jgi:ubiquinone/menaquinone biosynthesis C-methylase UbiE